MKVIKYLKKEYKHIRKALYKKTVVFNRKRILHRKYRKISYIVIAVLVIVNMTIFSFNAFSQMGVQEANNLESFAVVAYTQPGSHTWTVPNGVSSVDVLVVAGGGSGGSHIGVGTSTAGGGGGAGGVVFEENYSVNSGDPINIVIGSGGQAPDSGAGNNGSDSSFSSLTAIGGGGGGSRWNDPKAGGSGGGVGYYSIVGGLGTTGQGFDGGSSDSARYGGAGGGGASEAGGYVTTSDGTDGGNGAYYGDIFGDNHGENGWFAGGGGGGASVGYSKGIGGTGGAGDGGSNANGTDAIDGTGGGGGGSGNTGWKGGDGGSGVVIIKYKVNLGTLQGSTLNKGLVGYWSMDGVDYNSSTNRLTDKTPYSNHGTNYGATLTTDRHGRVGGAMSFDGVSDYISLPGSDFHSSDSDTFSVVAWIKPANFNQQSTIFGDRYGTTMTTGVRTSGKIYLNMDDTRASTACESNTSLPVNEWSHVVFRYNGDSKEVSFYINGEQDTKGWSYCYDGNGCGDSSTYYLGKDNRFFYRFEGLMDDVRTYNRILSESEIQSLYDSYEPKISAGSLNKGLVLDMPLTLKYTKKEIPAGSEIMTDKTPYSNDGQNSGAVISAEGGSFDGVNDYVKIDNVIVNNPSELTISSWIKKESGGSNYECALHHGSDTSVGNSAYWLGLSSTDNLTATIGARAGVGWSAGQTSLIANYGQWYHLTASWDGSVVRVYVDGNYEKQYNLGSYSSLTTPTRIGSSGDGTNYQFKGDVSNVKIYNRALSDSEVKSLYDKGRDSGSGMTIKPYGSVPGMAGLSCLDILNNNPSAINNDGVYWISPEGGTPFQVYCDMTTDGGGWTLATNIIDTAANNVPDTVSAVRAGWTEVSEGNLTSFSGAIAKDLSYFIGVDNLTDGLNPSNIRLCAIKNEDDKRCHSDGILASHYTFTGDSGVSASNNYLKMAASLSGTVDYGATVNGSDGRFVNYDLYLFKGDSYTGGGYVQQWSGDTANWHVWGYGVTQTNNLTNDREIYNNGSSDSGALREYTKGWEVWLR